jgi:hypothetical protein
VCRSRLLVEEGKLREAAELLLDTCQFARDLGYNQVLISEMISIAIAGLAIDELRDVILSGKLSKDDLVEVARELEILYGSFPRNGHSMMNEAMAAGYWFQKWDGNIQDLNYVGESRVNATYFLWRTVFTQRLICADAYFIELEYMKRIAAADEESWAVVEAVGSKAQVETSKLKNPIAQTMVPGLFSSSRPGRERRTHLQLLRAAAHYRATGQVPDLEDPFGARLLASEQGGKVKVWSVGQDRLDGGGNGGWKPKDGPDIVLEFEK